MTNPNLTEIICIVDRSGSMDYIRDDAIGGFNTFLKEQQALKVDRCLLTFAQFDDVYEVIHDGARIEDVPPLTHETFEPRGSTALLDAIGKTINTVGQRLAKTPEENRPGAVVVVILTDGNENSSKEFDRQKIFDMITKQREEYNWEFVFLAANQDAIQVGGMLGINHAANFSPNAAGVQGTYKGVSSSVGSYRSTKCSADLSVADSVIPDPNQSGVSGRIKT